MGLFAQKNSFLFVALVGTLLSPFGILAAHSEEANKTDEEYKVIDEVKVIKTANGEVTFKIKPLYYPLVDERIKPDLDEFYVSSIYSIGQHPKALIKQSTNARTGALFSEALEYGVGDKLGNDYTITAIRTGERKDVIVEHKKNHKQYFLRVNYGDAKSRLIPLSHTPYQLKSETQAQKSEKEQVLEELKELEEQETAPAKKAPKLKATMLD